MRNSTNWANWQRDTHVQRANVNRCARCHQLLLPLHLCDCNVQYSISEHFLIVFLKFFSATTCALFKIYADNSQAAIDAWYMTIVLSFKFEEKYRKRRRKKLILDRLGSKNNSLHPRIQDVLIRIRFESDVPIRKFRISRTYCVSSYHKLRSLDRCSTKTSTFAPFVVEIYVYNSTLSVAVML